MCVSHVSPTCGVVVEVRPEIGLAREDGVDRDRAPVAERLVERVAAGRIAVPEERSPGTPGSSRAHRPRSSHDLAAKGRRHERRVERERGIVEPRARHRHERDPERVELLRPVGRRDVERPQRGLPRAAPRSCCRSLRPRPAGSRRSCQHLSTRIPAAAAPWSRRRAARSPSASTRAWKSCSAMSSSSSESSTVGSHRKPRL